LALDLIGVVDRGKREAEVRHIVWLAGLVCSAAVLVFAPAAAAGNVTCQGVLSGPVTGNVLVPRGAECSLEFADVSGNVTAQFDATVSVLGSTVGGNYTCNNCEQAHLQGSTVDGNLQISHEKQYSVITNSTIRGNLQINDSRTDLVLFFIDSNEIRGNLSFNNNEGLAFITDNTIAGNLTCQNNDPAPASFGNTAKSMKGQCAP
jgi:hypothetical protein